MGLEGAEGVVIREEEAEDVLILTGIEVEVVDGFNEIFGRIPSINEREFPPNCFITGPTTEP